MPDIYGDINMKAGYFYENGVKQFVKPYIVADRNELESINPPLVGGNTGIFAGGYWGGNTCITYSEYCNFSSPGNATTLGNLYSTCWNRSLAGLSNGINNRGIFAGGNVWNSGWCEGGSTYSNVIQYFTINYKNNANSFGDLLFRVYELSGFSNGTLNRGITVGGHTGSTPVNTVQYITISSACNAIDFGDLLQKERLTASTSNDINNRGIIAGGYNNIAHTDQISYLSINSLGNAIDFGNLTFPRTWISMTSNGKLNRCIMSGGYEVLSWTSYSLNLLQYVNISIPGDAVNFGALSFTYKTYASSSISNLEGSLGLISGGYDRKRAIYLNNIERINIRVAPSNAVDFGNLQTAHGFHAGCSNGNAILYNVDDPPVYEGSLIINLEDHSLNICNFEWNSSYVDKTHCTKYFTKIVPGFDYDKALFAGGTTSSGVTDYIDSLNISTKSDAIDFNTLSVERNYAAATSNESGNRAVIAGGWKDQAIRSMEYIKIFGGGNSSYFGDLIEARYGLGGASNGENNRALFASGWSTKNIIDYISISSPGHAVNFGELLVKRGGTATVSNGVGNRAVFAGGYTGHNDIEFVTITNISNATFFGNLSGNRYGVTACSNKILNRIIFAGGYQSAVRVNIIEYINITILSSASNFGDINNEIRYAAATSNGILNRAVIAGGNISINVIDYVNINAPANAQDFGDLVYARYQLTATSNSN